MHRVLNKEKRYKEQRTGKREEKTGNNKTTDTAGQGRRHAALRSFGDPTRIAEG